MTNPLAIPNEIDVAFSFLATDEELARQLADVIRSSVSVFVYSERQKEIACTNGVLSLSQLYGERAKLVAVLYRKGYGDSHWTGIEANAITGRAPRALKSVSLISLDGTKPDWVPVHYLWYGIEKFGEDAAAQVILARFSDLGAVPHPETMAERIARGVAEHSAAERAEKWKNSDQGIQSVENQVAAFREYLAQQVGLMAVMGAKWLPRSNANPADVVQLRRRRVWFRWTRRAINSLYDAYLTIGEDRLVRDSAHNPTWNGAWSWRAEPFLDTATDTPRWRLQDSATKSYSTIELADFFVRRVIEVDASDGAGQF